MVEKSWITLVPLTSSLPRIHDPYQRLLCPFLHSLSCEDERTQKTQHITTETYNKFAKETKMLFTHVCDVGNVCLMYTSGWYKSLHIDKGMRRKNFETFSILVRFPPDLNSDWMNARTRAALWDENCFRSQTSQLILGKAWRFPCDDEESNSNESVSCWRAQSKREFIFYLAQMATYAGCRRKYLPSSGRLWDAA